MRKKGKEPRAVLFRKQTKNTWLFIGFFLLAGVCNLLNRTGVTWLGSLMFSLNFFIYAGLLLFWLQSVRVRLLPTRARSYILASAQMMLGALLLRVFRYRAVAAETLLSRFAAYAYWLYTLLIPTLFFMTALRLQRGEGKDQKNREAWLLVPALFLCLLALTNDLHSLVYLPKALPFDVLLGTYAYGAGFYAMVIWIGLMAVSGFAVLLRVTKKRAAGIMGYVVTVLLLWLGMETLGTFVFSVSDPPRLYMTPEIRIFSMLAIFEICIRSRLIPHNENHLGFFEKLTLPIQITDGSLAPVYHSAFPLRLSREELRASLSAPRYVNEDLKLSGMTLPAGYTFWTEDEGELHRENRRLEAANELLSEENDLIRVENQLREKKARLDAEEEVYRQIAAAIYPKQKRIEALLEGTAPDREDCSGALGRVCVLNAWSKRKSNLLLLSEDALPKRSRELFLALQESARFLSCCGVEAAAVGEEYTDFPLPLVHRLYDTFETVVEAWLPFLRRMTVSLTPEGLRMAVEAGKTPPLPPAPLPVKQQISDDIVFLTIRPEKGGEAP